MKPPPLHARVRPLAENEIRELEWRLPGRDLDLHRRRYDLQLAGEAVYLVAWYDETSIGHVLARDEEDAEILEDLFVLPPFRRRGVGAQIVARAEAVAEARGKRRVVAEVPAGNRPARRLLAARGYRVERDRPGGLTCVKETPAPEGRGPDGPDGESTARRAASPPSGNDRTDPAARQAGTDEAGNAGRLLHPERMEEDQIDSQDQSATADEVQSKGDR